MFLSNSLRKIPLSSKHVNKSFLELNLHMQSNHSNTSKIPNRHNFGASLFQTLVKSSMIYVYLILSKSCQQFWGEQRRLSYSKTNSIHHCSYFSELQTRYIDEGFHSRPISCQLFNTYRKRLMHMSIIYWWTLMPHIVTFFRGIFWLRRYKQYVFCASSVFRGERLATFLFVWYCLLY